MKLIDRLLLMLSGAAFTMGGVLLTIAETNRQAAIGWACVLVAFIALLASAVEP